MKARPKQLQIQRAGSSDLTVHMTLAMNGILYTSLLKVIDLAFGVWSHISMCGGTRRDFQNSPRYRL
jgi:hypothetical protein